MARFAIHARADLDWLEVFDYLVTRSPQAARRFSESVKETIRRIRDNPAIGGRLPLPDRDEQEWRRVTVTGFKSYQIIYRCTAEMTKIVRILHISRDIEAALRPNEGQ
jgi:plasmid stabilization system protein ParE